MGTDIEYSSPHSRGRNGNSIHIYGIYAIAFGVDMLLLVLVEALRWLAILLLMAGGLWFGVSLVIKALPILREKHQQEMQRSDRDLRARVIAIGERPGHQVTFEASGTVVVAPVTINLAQSGSQSDEEQETAGEPKDALPEAPPFSEIIDEVTPKHLFLGQSAQGEVWGNLGDLLSTLIAGRPGTGKSTQLRNVCGQILRVDGQPIIFDPHGSIVDDLGAAFETAENAQEIAERSVWLAAQLDSRLKARRAGERNFRPMLLLVDEMPIIHAMSPDALEAIRRIVLEGRKVNMFALVSGQGVPASILGGTLVRDAMSSRYVFCTSAQQARMAGIENEIAKKMMAQLEEAGPGKAILATASRKPQIVAVPYTTVDDIRLLVSMSGRAGNAGNRDGNGPETRQEAKSPVSHEVETEKIPASVKDTISPDGNSLAETIKRLRARNTPHRDIAYSLGMSGRRYSEYQDLCQRHGIDLRQEGA